MANTTNLNLEKPLGTDQALVSVINSNSDKIDAFAGTTNQALSNVTNAKRMNVSSLADFQSQLETLIGTMANEAVVAIHYHPAAAYAPFQDQDYYGSVYRNNANSFTVTLAYRNEAITGGKQGTEWSWNSLALKSEPPTPTLIGNSGSQNYFDVDIASWPNGTFNVLAGSGGGDIGAIVKKSDSTCNVFQFKETASDANYNFSVTGTTLHVVTGQYYRNVYRVPIMLY